MKKVTHDPITAIDYNNYDLLVLFVDDQEKYLACITDFAKQSEHVRFQIASVYQAVNFKEDQVHAPYLKEVFEYNFPESVVKDVSRGEICLSESEREQASRWLDHYIRDEKLIIYLDKASSFWKMLRMSESVSLIKYFQNIPGRKLVMFDPFNENRVQFYESLGVDTKNILMLSGITLRQAFAVMADSRVELIMGPCTGLMHAASGIYNTLCKSHPGKKMPIMLVYTGLYTDEVMTNAGVWWSNKLTDCMVIRRDENNRKKIFGLTELTPFQITTQANVLPCKEYTFEMIREYLVKHYEFGVAVNSSDAITENKILANHD